MPKIGELYWVATVKGGSEAARTADSLEDSLGSVGATASQAAEKQNELAAKTGEAAEESATANRWTRRLRGAHGLLASALFFTTDQLGVTAGVMWAYTAATEAATFATGTLYATLVGPAGIAGALALTVLGVGLLGTELLGLTDLTPVVESETDTMKGAFADMAYLVGGPLVGFMSAGFSLVTGDFEGAKQKFVNTSVEWAKAAARFAARVHAGFGAFGIALKTGMKATVETLDYVWRSGWNAIASGTNSILQGIANSVVAGMQKTINSAVGLVNQAIRKTNRLRKKLGLGEYQTLGSVSLAAPTVAPIPGVENEALDSRLSRVHAEGQADLSALRATTRARLAQFAPDTIGGRRPTRTGLEGRRSDPTVGEMTINVEIGDQTLDIRNLNRAERRELARFIGEELGGNTTGIAGVK